MSNVSAESPIETTSSNAKSSADSVSVDHKNVHLLENEIETLRIQNEAMRAKLLEASMVANNYLQEANNLKEQLDKLTNPPLFISLVM